MKPMRQSVPIVWPGIREHMLADSGVTSKPLIFDSGDTTFDFHTEETAIGENKQFEIYLNWKSSKLLTGLYGIRLGWCEDHQSTNMIYVKRLSEVHFASTQDCQNAYALGEGCLWRYD